MRDLWGRTQLNSEKINAYNISSISSIAEIFKTYANYGDVPAIGIINWSSSLAPDANLCVAFIFNYIIMAFSVSGSMYVARNDNSTWVKLN